MTLIVHSEQQKEMTNMLVNFRALKDPKKTLLNRIGRELKESDIEDYLTKQCKDQGWMAEKFTSPSKRSVPDRMVTTQRNTHFPGGFVFFIELKAPGKSATKAQKADHVIRRARGNLVMVCDSYEQVNTAIAIVAEALMYGAVPELPLWLIV